MFEADYLIKSNRLALCVLIWLYRTAAHLRQSDMQAHAILAGLRAAVKSEIADTALALRIDREAQLAALESLHRRAT